MRRWQGIRAIAALAVCSPLLAQAISPGLRVGVPITSTLHASGPERASTQRYTIGPTVEIDLWRGAGMGADFLIRSAAIAAGASRATVRRWELPVWLMYGFRRAFVRAGISFNHVVEETRPLAEMRHRGTYGPVAGAGLRWRFKQLRIEPELRLTHWNDRNFGVRDSAVRSNLNQIDLLLGVTF